MQQRGAILAKYELLAAQIRHQIARGVWGEHEKLPSLRRQSEQSGYSLMTVLSAYQLLESQGLIYSRSRSGYRVTPSAENATAPLIRTSEMVSINDFVFDVLQASRDPLMYSLGFAYPDPGLYPRQQLSKSMTVAARELSVRNMLDNMPPGNEHLRKIIARRYAARGIEISPDEIVITAGALEALSLSLQATTQPGDWVVIESPAFYGAMQALERLGLKAITVKVSPEEGLDVNALERAFQQHPVKACWLMSSYQNPVGYSLSEEQKRKTAALVSQYQVALIEDDVYCELYPANQPPSPIRYYVPDGESMLCSSFSKTLVAGYRIGWVVAGKRAQDIQRCQLMSTMATSVPVQLALADYLSGKNYEAHLRQLRRKLAARKQAMFSFMSEILEGIAVVYYQPGGYFLWIECQPDVDTMEIYRQALTLSMTIAPGRMFSLSDDFRHCFRINASFELNEARKVQLKRLSSIISDLSTVQRES